MRLWPGRRGKDRIHTLQISGSNCDSLEAGQKSSGHSHSLFCRFTDSPYLLSLRARGTVLGWMNEITVPPSQTDKEVIRIQRVCARIEMQKGWDPVGRGQSGSIVEECELSLKG